MGELECRKIGPAPNGGLWQGVHLGDAVSVSPFTINDFAQTSGAEVDFALRFVSFESGLNFPTASANGAASTGATLFVKLEPWNPARPDQNSYRLEDISAGRYDDLLRNFAEGAKRFGRPIFVTFGHEMNIGSYPWGNQPEAYKRAYQHVHNIMAGAGACNLTWVFNADASQPAANYYPGESYVDWVAVDGYNSTDSGAPWRSCSDIFTQRLNELEPLGKPLMIGEFASDANSPEEEQQKAGWVGDCVNYFADSGRVRAFAYFNQDKVENGERQRWAIRTPEARNAFRDSMTAAESKRDGLFRARILPPTPLPALRNSPTGSADFGLGQTSSELRPVLDPDLIKIRFQEGELNLEAVEGILSAVVDQIERPAPAGFSPMSARQEDFIRHFHDLAAIKQIDRTQRHEFFWYFADPREYWNNVITLLSSYTQECMETGQTYKLPATIEWTRKIRQRLEQLETNKKARPEIAANNSERVLPSDFAIASLYFLEAEANSQVKNQTADYYWSGIDLVLKGLERIKGLENKPLYPSKLDIFTYLKGITALGDLYQKLAQLTKRNEYYETAFNLYRQASGINDRSGLRVNLSLPVRNEARPLALSLTPENINEAIDFNITRGYIRKENRGKVLAGIYQYQRGIALLKQAGALVAWPRLKSIDDVAEQIVNIERAKEALRLASNLTGENDLTANTTFRAVGKMIDQAFPGLFWRDDSVGATVAAQINTIDRVNSSFFLDLATMIEGELLLLLADRIRYYPENSTANQRIVNSLKQFPELAAALDQGQTTANAKYLGVVERADFDRFGERKDDIWRALRSANPRLINIFSLINPGFSTDQLNNLGIQLSDSDKAAIAGIFQRAYQPGLYSGDQLNRTRLADILITAARDSFFPTINPRFGYLHAWAGIKQLEIDVRDAGYVVRLNFQGELFDPRNDFNSKIRPKNDPREQLARAEELGRRLPESNISPTEYLGVSFDFMRVIYLLAGIPGQNPDGSYLRGKNRVNPGETLALIDQIRDNYRDFNEEDRLYFEVQLNLREAGALIQQKNYDQALALLRAGERLVAPPLPSHLADKLQQVRQALASGNLDPRLLESANKIIGVARTLLEYKGRITSHSFSVSENKRLPIQEALVSAGCLDRGGKVKPDFLNRQGQFAAALRTKNILLTPAETSQIFEVLDQTDVFARLASRMGKLSPLVARRDYQAAATALGEIMDQLGRLDNSAEFERKYGERLTLDLHSIRAELYHFTTVAASLSRERPSGDVIFEYGQSTYFESRRSTIKYDIYYRPTFLTMDFPDIAEDQSAL
ncbi:hypothetical protein A3K48_04615 [candidate division WOR-1 bacterium RIFOXYA12_FULL_52_29]|uniref:GH26 domain-containing protein n=1 Tax=candidate division WOR-1 bacterium RIFOXYC12_FULL_54_18 TaxID=1802584 RepID=A0A1F4T6A8_UNCSA|nr:MAG: hypothetical protein A3K44_04615 [candidate division WOR-1 bacterium RIFOXYA2_FULL_51_19]OGC17831.1 MAG: hypothetical protein A3K48_04615 [candidate division WOR-1 bacterium RIFOXYA12_FULL_52_29]OGC26688.1 MAG: hypothetical protein A3K32_04610 [candidate division WOR-1 bacterium RIFOXYB2_FULL_45_9]OGC28248.1 MAG: hypothetical protein A3K49_04615 [candidate division WOR-1 bacterium RIFOXYC12_FULL_54_18]OGC29464.1 MAG: hypothetical protein A2346_01720 [candidate division WOR-1 bacterium R